MTMFAAYTDGYPLKWHVLGLRVCWEGDRNWIEMEGPLGLWWRRVTPGASLRIGIAGDLRYRPDLVGD